MGSGGGAGDLATVAGNLVRPSQRPPLHC